jgi:hypothetical protein
MSGIAGRYQEALHIPWFPEFKHGMPAYDSRYWTWDFYEARDGDYNTDIAIQADGVVVFREGDGDGVSLEMTLKHPFEMGELLELIQQLTPDNCDRASFQEVPWSSIVQDIFVLVPSDKEQRLLKFSWSAWANQRPELLAPFKVFYKGEVDGLNEMKYSTWREWFDRNAPAEALVFAGELKEDDLLFSPCNGFRGARIALKGYNACQDSEPQLVIRLKQQQSRMYFVDFLQHTKEGAALFNALYKDLENLPQLLSQAKVRYPTTRLVQIRLGVELRVARHAYDEKVRSLMQVREPADQLQDRYRKRAKYVALLHTDYLAELEEQQHPLPFMIEWPLRRYKRAEDPLLKLKYGQQLLNIIVKLPLFLVLEELRANPTPLPQVEPIESELFGKPTSDGALLKCLEDAQRVVSEMRLPLPLFDPLLRRFKMEGVEPVKRIITARNRYHHAPYDEEGMRAALDAELPSVIRLFRETLEGMIFIIPESLKSSKGELVVVARPLMGHETDFPRQEITTSAPFSAFPDGHVVVVSPQRDRALPLPQFFKIQPIRTISIDVGVFDRMVKGHPEYVFIRGLGEEAL